MLVRERSPINAEHTQGGRPLSRSSARLAEALWQQGWDGAQRQLRPQFVSIGQTHASHHAFLLDQALNPALDDGDLGLHEGLKQDTPQGRLGDLQAGAVAAGLLLRPPRCLRCSRNFLLERSSEMAGKRGERGEGLGIK